MEEVRVDPTFQEEPYPLDKFHLCHLLFKTVHAKALDVKYVCYGAWWPKRKLESNQLVKWEIQLKSYAKEPRAWESAHYFIIKKKNNDHPCLPPQLDQDSEVFALFYWEEPDSSYFRPMDLAVWSRMPSLAVSTLAVPDSLALPIACRLRG